MGREDVDETAFADAKAYLTQQDANGRSIYDHLSKVILKLLEQKPSRAFQQFENISLEVKSQTFQPKDSQNGDDACVEFDSTLATRRSNLFKSWESNDVEGESPQLPNEGDISDLLDEANLFEWGGIGLGKEETYRIMLAMKQLLESKPLKNVRFFGKIFGRTKDYLICESEWKDGKEDEESKPPGPNKFTYWVINSPGEEWIRLPHTKPADIIQARSIRKFLTGDLNAPVAGFNGTEKEFLRAQIARIASGTVVSPKGYYYTEDEDDGDAPLVVNQEFEGLDPIELLKHTNWVHHYPNILSQGATSFLSARTDTGDEDEDEESTERTTERSETYEEGPKLLTEIMIANKWEPWTTKLSSNQNTKYCHVILRSNRWPGAYAFAKDDRFANIYIGFGVKYTGEPYSPALPPLPQSDRAVPNETAEPTVEEEEKFENENKNESTTDGAEETEEGEDFDDTEGDN